jgi:hypothetical protein
MSMESNVAAVSAVGDALVEPEVALGRVDEATRRPVSATAAPIRSGAWPGINMFATVAS